MIRYICGIVDQSTKASLLINIEESKFDHAWYEK